MPYDALGSFGNSWMLYAWEPSLGYHLHSIAYPVNSCKNSLDSESLVHCGDIVIGVWFLQTVALQSCLLKAFSTFENILFRSLLGNLNRTKFGHLKISGDLVSGLRICSETLTEAEKIVDSLCLLAETLSLKSLHVRTLRLIACFALCLALWKTGSRTCQSLGTWRRRNFGNATNARSNRFLDAVRSLHLYEALVVGQM